MKTKFGESTIPELYCKTLMENCYLLGPTHAFRVAHSYFDAISRYLGSIKLPNTPKALIIRSLNGTFLVAAKVEYIPNEDDPTNPASGKWDYNWTFYEDDLEDNVMKIEFATDNNILAFIRGSGVSLYGMRFADGDAIHYMVSLFFEHVSKWLEDNAPAGEEPNTLELEGVFVAATSTCDGEVVKAIVPDGEMKVLIKNDSAIQEQ